MAIPDFTPFPQRRNNAIIFGNPPSLEPAVRSRTRTKGDHHLGRGCGRRTPGTPGVLNKVTTAAFTVSFWGVRGSLSCPGSEYVRYGGNTSCLEVRCGPYLLIMDGGTGMRPLGRLIANGPIDADIFFTHTHLDHIVGLPFFAPLYQPTCNLCLWAGHLMPHTSLKDALAGMMMEPLFPMPLNVFASRPDYHDFLAGDVLNPRPGVTVRTAPLNHPNGATGYRIDYDGRSLCYVTDCEHKPGTLDPLILDLVQAPTCSSTIRPTPIRNSRSMSAGAIPPGRKACGWPTPPR